MWALTVKRRENLVKICLSMLTVDLAGVIVPFILQTGKFNVTICAIGAVVIVMLIIAIYLLER